MQASTSCSASLIEYVKFTARGSNLITHAGADMFLRECYNPNDWHHEMFVIDGEGDMKRGAPENSNVAGPLCFGGDFIARDIELPKCEQGDWLVIEDVGANTFSLWSRHCSRPFPKVIALNSRTDPDEVWVAKERESNQDIVRFWS